MKGSSRRRVAVTGWGALSPLGIGLESYRRWQAQPRQPATAATPSRVPDFRPADYVANPKRLRSMHRNFQVMAAAAVLAMRDAGLPAEESLPAAGIAPARAGIASAIADLSPLTRDLLEVLARWPSGGDTPAPLDWAGFAEIALHHLHPFRRLGLLPNMATAHTSLLFGLQGPSFTFTSGEAAGAQALTQAFWAVADGHADLLLCQSAESPEQAFATTPPAETGGALVLEAWESAERRRAVIRAELLPDSHHHLPAPVAAAGVSHRASPVTGFLQALLVLAAAPAGTPVTLAQLRQPLTPAAVSPAEAAPAEAPERLARKLS